MDAKQINATFDLLSLVGDLHKAGGYHVGPCPFCGGRDRFTVKHAEDGDRWHCRQCGDGKYHTAIDYIMRRDSVDFKTAIQILGGDVDSREFIPRTASKGPDLPTWMKSEAKWRAPEWQADAWRIIHQTSDWLFNPGGELGQEYLASRALHKGTWYSWLLGFEHHYDSFTKRKRPAIVIPWLDFDRIEDAVIMAVKYRFIDELAKQDPNRRFTALAGSASVLFGLGHAVPSHQTLLFIEGEFNCLSVNQCMPSGLTCLSFGSEGGGDERTMQAIAEHYEHVFVWADDLWDNPRLMMRAKDLRALVKGNGKKLQSVKQDGIKFDANELLKREALHSFLTQILGVQCLQDG